MQKFGRLPLSRSFHYVDKNGNGPALEERGRKKIRILDPGPEIFRAKLPKKNAVQNRWRRFFLSREEKKENIVTGPTRAVREGEMGRAVRAPQNRREGCRFSRLEKHFGSCESFFGDTSTSKYPPPHPEESSRGSFAEYVPLKQTC